MERQGLIENGYLDEDQDDHVDLLEDMEHDSDIDKSEVNLKTPDVQEIERNLRKKLEQKKTKYTPKAKKETSPVASATTKSFIEQQIQEFKDQRNRKVKPSEIDFERLLNPKHKKKPTEIESHCSF